MKKKYLSQYICTIYICTLFILFPLIMHNKLFDIVETKRNWFVGITFVASVLCLLSALSSQQKISLKPSLPDYFMIAFISSNIISYLLTSHKNIALYGSYGRAFGLFTIIIISLSYFTITRFSVFNKYICMCIMIGSSLTGIIGILNFFGIDLFGIYKTMASHQTDFYISTLGHTNIYSSFFAITLPFGIIMYIKSTDKKSQMFYLISSLVSFLGLAVGNSDSGYITIGAILLLTPIFLKNSIELTRFIFLLLCGIISARLLGVIYTVVNCNRLIDSLTRIMILSNYLLPVVFILIMLMFFLIYQLKHDINNFNTVRKIIIIAEASLFLLLIVAIISANITNYNGSLSNLLIWSDHWGSNRGFIWKRGLILFTQHYSMKEIIWGCGPDSIKPLLEHHFGHEMTTGVFEHYNNVHNEYLQYLLTLGITGITAYVGLIISTLKSKFNILKNSSVILALFTSMICYLLQAFVNINQAVTTPLFFVIIALLNNKHEIQDIT